MKALFEKVFGSYSERELKRMDPLVKKIEALDSTFAAMSNETLRAKTIEYKARLAQGETLDDLLPEAFATVREAAWRVLGLKHYPVQLYGGIVLHQGRISEMKTGEGKTLMATLPVYLNALSDKGVHVVTVNDYLARRDCEWMGKVYEFLGMTTGVNVHGLSPAEKKAIYEADITYGTNNEFGFDYLRDNMVIQKDNMVQRDLNYVIVDEVDSILIDEARTPLIISGEGEKSTQLYALVDHFVRGLKNEIHYNVDEKANSVALTEEGVEIAEKHFSLENLSDPENMEISHHINQALKANNLMKRDKDYVVKDGEVIIVDDFTGRLMFGRRYSDGLHQAIEAKEGLDVRRESRTLATITFQNYFRMYQKIAGMTGTAKTEEEEFKAIYGMDVVEIPTNEPVVREDHADAIYKNEPGKYAAVVEEIIEHHATGQPVLVGTISIERSELISRMLQKKGVKHEVLNAKQHEREAEIVAQAGRKGAVTIATNMAGRGTDILLGGNPEFLAKRDLKAKGIDDEVLAAVTALTIPDDPEIQAVAREYERLHQQYKQETDTEHQAVIAAGGLHIIGTERHESRRIDNQLRGRAGRQGDPGSSRFFISLEDDLMRLFGGERMQGLVEKLGLEDDMAIEHGMLSRSIENAQKKVEGRNFGIRKHVLQYDDVMNKQREVIYNERRKVLDGEDMRDQILAMVETIIDSALELYTANSEYPEEWELEDLNRHLQAQFSLETFYDASDVESLTKHGLREEILQHCLAHYEVKEQEISAERLREIERILMLRVVDTKWMDHIDAMDQLKQGIGLRAIGQEDPVRAYQKEGFDMFQEMIRNIQEETVKVLFHLQKDAVVQRKAVVKVNPVPGSDGSVSGSGTVVNKEKVGRNDPCPCGSGKKYKKCCGV
ncbi:preprotein translocase subunit SecA [Anoxynatronum buryatiense]|uniref:Protein translocase subunit SecA n=1 Tax=Anoxynatronum buryatiense TaxID=489973 RepID=A0AA45WY59_9CLOT|nr:preprotein translocase subunit SecA [Anoxynatronum buryatiense]SMP67320.1 protein translocase subunit secA [Anoxynatronum buryatiense]